MTGIASKEDFKSFVEKVKSDVTYVDPVAFAVGVRRTRGDKTLDVLYPVVNFRENSGAAAVLFSASGMKECVNGSAILSKEELQSVSEYFAPYHEEREEHPNVSALFQLLQVEQDSNTYAKTDFVISFLWDEMSAVESTEEAYLKLQLISQRKVIPHTVSLDGIFAKLPNIAWTNYGPMLPEDVDRERVRLFGKSVPLTVSHVDKFPYLLNYHIPSGVRVAAGHKVRLGAHLAEGTTVMQAGFVNFNAGTLGNAMIEGRVSAGVVVGKDSDIGGGASIMGTLSGGNDKVLAVGERCLLSANAGTGISLGDGSTIAAGLYVTAGTKVSLYDLENRPVSLTGDPVEEGENIVKALELSEKPDLLFYHDSVSGKVICKPNKKSITLNEALHAHN